LRVPQRGAIAQARRHDQLQVARLIAPRETESNNVAEQRHFVEQRLVYTPPYRLMAFIR
jgi:hypothetical protein